MTDGGAGPQWRWADCKNIPGRAWILRDETPLKYRCGESVGLFRIVLSHQIQKKIMMHLQVRRETPPLLSGGQPGKTRWKAKEVLAGVLLLTGHASAALPPGNVLENPSGAAEANVGWTLTAGPLSPPAYSTGWRKDGGVGVPDHLTEYIRQGFGGKTSYRQGYFRTSYSPNKCTRNQLVDLQAKGATPSELDAAPDIKVGEWISCYATNGTPADTFYITVKLLAADGVTELASWTADNTTAGATPTFWTLFQHTFSGYGPGLRYVRFESGGWDSGGWAGQYGSFHDESFVEFSADTDADGMPDAFEAAYGGGAGLDPEGDLDVDNVLNSEEYLLGSKIDNQDSDGDGLFDGEEVSNQTHMLVADTDGDGLSDGLEVKTVGSDPKLPDSDNDGFSDAVEVNAVPPASPINAAENPAGVLTAKGFSLGGLTQPELTDPENDGVDTTANGTAFNWSAIQASVNGTFLGTNGEGAYSVFDNRVGQTGSKWLVATLGTTQWVQVKFNTLTSLTGFSLTSANDVPERDPLVWEIQGSMDDVASNPANWTPIFRWDYGSPPWTPGERLNTFSVTLPKKTLPYRWLRFQVYSVRSGTSFQLDEIEYFGEQSNADADGDGIPKLVEDFYAFLSDGNPGDALLDQDGDELDNFTEYLNQTGLSNPDSDGDGLLDGPEINVHGTKPLVADTDGEGLNDYQEVGPGGSGTNPLKADTDGDGFSDFAELNAGSPTDPLVNTSNPAGTLATKGTALLGSDLTDPDNNGSDTTAAGTNFNWNAIQSSVNGTFLGTSGEGAYSVFDNRVGLGGSKWLVATLGTSQWIQVKFNTLTSLTGFTLTSANDSPERDPLVWEIQGSLDDVNTNPGNWSTIYRWDHGSPPWAATERLTTYSVTLPKKTLPYKWLRFQVYSVRSGATFQLDEIEYFGEQTDADADADGIPKLVEDFYDFLDDSVAGDAFLDEDDDGLDNGAEWVRRTGMINPDSDGDQLEDGEEVNLLGSNPRLADSDADGLTDFEEAGPGGYGTSPILADSDSDGFTDFQELRSIPPTDPKSAASAPYFISIVGTGNAALLGGDLTDPENDLNDNVGAPTAGGNPGSGFNWVATYTNSGRNYFNGSSQTSGNNEGVLNLFDNKVGGGEAKWCCESAPRFITVEFANPVSLDHFTLTSGNDSLDRSPSEWEVAGSNDNVNYTSIAADTSPGSHHWTAVNQVIRFDLNAPAPPYKFIKFTIGDTAAVSNPVTNAIQFSEIEYFAAVVQDPFVIDSGFNPEGDFEIEVGGLDTGLWYRLYRSLGLNGDWTPVGVAVSPAASIQTFIDGDPPQPKAFYKVEDVPAP